VIRTYVFSMWAGIRNLSELCVVYFAELNNLARDADFWVAVQKSPRLPDFCTGRTQIDGRNWRRAGEGVATCMANSQNHAATGV